MDAISITIRGIKGLEGTATIGPRTVLTGPVGAGKSAVLFGLQLALFGRVPSIGIGEGGKQDLARLRRYMRDGASVQVAFPDGRIFGRKIEYTEKAARLVTKAQTADGAALEGADAEALIADWRQDALCCSWRPWVEGNDRQKREMLMGYFPGLDSGDALRWVQCEALAAVADVDRDGDSPHRVRHGEDDLRAYRIGAEAAAGAGHPAIAALTNDKAPSLAARIEAIHGEAKRTENERKARNKAVEGLAVMNGGKADSARIAGELPALEERLRGLDQEAARLDQQAKAHGDAARKGQEARGRLQRATDALARLEAEKGRLVSAEALAAAHGDATAKRKMLEAAKPQADDKAAVKLAKAIGDAESNLRVVMEAGRQHKAVYLSAKGGECPLTHGACTGDLKGAMDTAAGELRNLAAAKAELEASLKSMRQEADALTRQAKAHDAALATWRDSTQGAINQEADARSAVSRWPKLMQEINDCKASLEAASADVEAAAPTAAPDETYRDAIKAQQAKLATEIKSLRDAKARLDVVAGADLDQAEREAKIWKLAYQGAVKGRNAYLQSRTARTQAAMDRAVVALGLGESFRLDLGSPDLVCGVMRGGEYIDCEALSGGQQVLFGAAFLAALPERRDGQHRIIMVEGVEAGHELPRLLAYLRTVPADYIPVATATDPGEVEGWTRCRVPEDVVDEEGGCE